MVKQIRVVINGKVTQTTLECYSWDGGRSLSSSPIDTLRFLRRRKKVMDTRLNERELRWLGQLDFPDVEKEHNPKPALQVHWR